MVWLKFNTGEKSGQARAIVAEPGNNGLAAFTGVPSVARRKRWLQLWRCRGGSKQRRQQRESERSGLHAVMAITDQRCQRGGLGHVNQAQNSQGVQLDGFKTLGGILPCLVVQAVVWTS